MGHLGTGGMLRRGASDRKNPLPVTNLRRGCQRRAVWNLPQAARLPARRRTHCSAPHCKGYCSMNIPALHRGSSHLRVLI